MAVKCLVELYSLLNFLVLIESYVKAVKNNILVMHFSPLHFTFHMYGQQNGIEK